MAYYLRYATSRQANLLNLLNLRENFHSTLRVVFLSQILQMTQIGSRLAIVPSRQANLLHLPDLREAFPVSHRYQCHLWDVPLSVSIRVICGTSL